MWVTHTHQLRAARLILVSILVSLMVAPWAYAAEIAVTTTTDEVNLPGDENGECSLREAVLSAELDGWNTDCVPGSGDDIINIPAGTYVLSLQDCDGIACDHPASTTDIDIRDGSVQLLGAGVDETIIDANSNGDLLLGEETQRAFEVYEDEDETTEPCEGECSVGIEVLFSNMTITNGYPDGNNGGAVGIFNSDDPCVYPSVSMTNVKITNSSAENGGAIHVNGLFTGTNLTLSENYADQDGGAIDFDVSETNSCDITMTLSDSTVEDNEAGDDGGAFKIDEWTQVTIVNTVIDNNDSYDDGGAFKNEGGVSCTGCTITNNHAEDDGGAIHNDSEEETSFLTLINSTISNNSTYCSGGGINLEAGEDGRGRTVTISGSTISGNTSYDCSGRGIRNAFNTGPVEITGSTISGNQAYYSGGGIWNDWVATVSKSTISGNSTLVEDEDEEDADGGEESSYGGGSHKSGGGIFNWGHITLTNSTISGNTSIGSGAGIFQSVSEGYYYACYHDEGQPEGDEELECPAPGGTFLNNVTVTNNSVIPYPDNQQDGGSSYLGGGVAVSLGVLFTGNTIVAGNFDLHEPDPEEENGIEETTFAPDCWVREDIECDGELCPRLASQGHNLVGDNTGCELWQSNTGDVIGTGESPIDPKLGPLMDNGGLTMTHALALDSPAVDTANGATELDVFDSNVEPDPDTLYQCLNGDQREKSRSFDGDLDLTDRCDVGAYELIFDCDQVVDGEKTLDSGGTCCEESERDQCGICFGDGSLCTDPGCNEVDITSQQFEVDGSSLRMSKIAKRAARKVRRAGGDKSAKNFASNIVASAETAYLQAWGQTWSLPPVIKDTCENQVLCVEVDNSPAVNAVSSASETLLDLVKSAVKRLRRETGNPKAGKRLRKRARLAHQSNLVQLQGIPLVDNNCL